MKIVHVRFALRWADDERNVEGCKVELVALRAHVCRNGGDKGRKRFVDLLNHAARSIYWIERAMLFLFLFSFFLLLFVNKSDEEFSYITKRIILYIIQSDSPNWCFQQTGSTLKTRYHRPNI